MDNYVEWDGTDWGLDTILEWYSKLPAKSMTIGLESTTFGRDIKPQKCSAHFYPDASSMEEYEFPRNNPHAIEMHAGDRVCYREFDGVYLLPNPGELEFNDPEDSFKVTGRGICYSSGRWKLPEGWWEPWDLTGRMVKINGHEVKIIGVDAFASMRSPSSPYRHSFALCVSEEDAEKIGQIR